MPAKATRLVLFAKAEGKMLAVLPTKNLPRPRKDGKGTTKGMAEPWDFAGGKLEAEETSWDALVRELKEETGLIFEDLGAIQVASPVYERSTKTDVYHYEIPKAVPVTPGEGIKECKWVFLKEALRTGSFPLQRALAVADQRYLRPPANDDTGEPAQKKTKTSDDD